MAYWNVFGRRLEWTGQRWELDGRPLRFYHFSGYDPNRPWLLSLHQGERPRVLLSENPPLARLCQEYGEALACTADGREAEPYAFDRLPGGGQVDGPIRRLYRNALSAAEAGRGDEPPDPFDPATTEAFLSWLNEPIDRSGVSRYWLWIRGERPDLQAAFPHILGADAPVSWSGPVPKADGSRSWPRT